MRAVAAYVSIVQKRKCKLVFFAQFPYRSFMGHLNYFPYLIQLLYMQRLWGLQITVIIPSSLHSCEKDLIQRLILMLGCLSKRTWINGGVVETTVGRVHCKFSYVWDYNDSLSCIHGSIQLSSRFSNGVQTFLSSATFFSSPWFISTHSQARWDICRAALSHPQQEWAKPNYLLKNNFHLLISVVTCIWSTWTLDKAIQWFF